MRYTHILFVVTGLVAVAITAQEDSVVVTSQKTAHTKKQPSHKKLQEQLGSAIREAFTVTRAALSRYARHMRDTNISDRMVDISHHIEQIAHDQGILQTYLDQLISGTPAVSRAGIQERLQHVEQIRQRWNIS